MRCHGKEGAAYQAGEERVWFIESEINVEDSELAGVVGLREDRAPAAIYSPAKEIHGCESPEEIDAGLEYVGPDHRGHPAMVCVDKSQCAEDKDRERHNKALRNGRSENQRDRNRRGEDAHRV